jgi:hypothetical protein
MDEAFCRGFGANAGALFPDHLEDFVGEDNVVRVIDVFVEAFREYAPASAIPGRQQYQL